MRVPIVESKHVGVQNVRMDRGGGKKGGNRNYLETVEFHDDAYDTFFDE